MRSLPLFTLLLLLQLLITIILLLHSSFSSSSHLPTKPIIIGATYTFPAPPAHPPSPTLVTTSVTTLLRLPSLRLPNPDPTLIRSFSFTNTSLFLSIPNPFLPPLASNRSLALRWVYGHVLPFYPRSKITLISVGNDPPLSPFLLPAIRNIHSSLMDLGIKTVHVSTTFSLSNLVNTPFPPSSATFQEPLGQLIIKPLLQFLDDTNSSFLVNIYPYYMYRANSEIPLSFALFQDHPYNFRDDLLTGVRYRNLFDMMVDALVASLAVMGHQNTPIVVAETGWPSSGVGPGESADANQAYSEMYVKGLVAHLRSGEGTPLRKEGVLEAYIYELVDEYNGSGSNYIGGRNWGLLYSNFTTKYELAFLSTHSRSGSGSGSCHVGRHRSLILSLFIYWLWFLHVSMSNLC